MFNLSCSQKLVLKKMITSGTIQIEDDFPLPDSLREAATPPLRCLMIFQVKLQIRDLRLEKLSKWTIRFPMAMIGQLVKHNTAQNRR
jgi:hypothetical protein